MKKRGKFKSTVKLVRKFIKKWRRNPKLLLELHYCNSFQFSQFGEDVVLNHFFGDRDEGFYVDVGAFHPFKFSNTYLFYRKGWRGINIEPNPIGYSEFVQHRNRDININCAVAKEEKEVLFYCDDVYSGIDDKAYIYKGRNPGAKRITMLARPLREVLREVLPDTKIDFMSIDCEGLDAEVIQSNDWERFRPEVLLVEDHGEKGDASLDELLLKFGYGYYCELQLTKIFVDQGIHPSIPQTKKCIE